MLKQIGLAVLLLNAGIGLPAQAQGLDAWLVDSLLKVFPDDQPAPAGQEFFRVLIPRNGHASLQVAVRPDADLADFRVAVSLSQPVDLKIQVRHVGYVPVRSNTPKAPQDELIRTAPSEFPDPLFEVLPSRLKAGRTESFWITLYAPAPAEPGIYSGVVALSARGSPGQVLPFEVEISRAAVPVGQPLQVTNWLYTGRSFLGRFYDLDSSRDNYWTVLENMGRVLAQHGQNTILTPVGDLVRPVRRGDEWHFDFADLDRWVETFTRAGVIGTIEGGHLLSRSKGYYSSIVVPIYREEDGKIVRRAVPPGDPEAELFLGRFLDAVYIHLQKRGWTQIYVQHVHDEPHGEEIAVFERFAQLVRRHLPGIRTIDAVDLEENSGFLSHTTDIWVPVLGSFNQRFEDFRKHEAGGGEVWFYTCVVPQGRHLNRFIDFSLLKVRLLHWFNFRHGLGGYLHWGGNYWTDSPFDDVQPVINDGRTLLPAGDSAIIYPDPSNQSVLSSIRLEMMREGIEDYKLLRLLAERRPQQAEQLVREAVPEVTNFIREAQAFRTLHHRLLEALSVIFVPSVVN